MFFDELESIGRPQPTFVPRVIRVHWNTRRSLDFSPGSNSSSPLKCPCVFEGMGPSRNARATFRLWRHSCPAAPLPPPPGRARLPPSRPPTRPFGRARLPPSRTPCPPTRKGEAPAEPQIQPRAPQNAPNSHLFTTGPPSARSATTSSLDTPARHA